MSKHDIALQDKLAYYLLKSVNKAVRDYEMIQNGDRVLVAVSGGKDSLTLLHLLRLRQRSAAEKYHIIAVHVAMLRSDGMPCSGSDARVTLGTYLAAQGQAYAFETIETDEQPDCFRCSRLRRKALFVAAQRLGCNKIALGHHADDAAQTTLLNIAFHGKVETLNPKRAFFGGQFVLIRPLIYVPEKEIVRFAQAQGFPPGPACCPRSLTSRRLLAKDIIRTLEREYPKVKINLFRAGTCVA
jgi:tRNA 2-thiocytidine biosynthesis protein TtcA